MVEYVLWMVEKGSCYQLLLQVEIYGSRDVNLVGLPFYLAPVIRILTL